MEQLTFKISSGVETFWYQNKELSELDCTFIKTKNGENKRQINEGIIGGALISEYVWYVYLNIYDSTGFFIKTSQIVYPDSVKINKKVKLKQEEFEKYEIDIVEKSNIKETMLFINGKNLPVEYNEATKEWGSKLLFGRSPTLFVLAKAYLVGDPGLFLLK